MSVVMDEGSVIIGRGPGQRGIKVTLSAHSSGYLQNAGVPMDSTFTFPDGDSWMRYDTDSVTILDANGQHLAMFPWSQVLCIQAM